MSAQQPVSGEAVVLELGPASFVTRGLAAALDAALVVLLVLVLTVVLVDVGAYDVAAGEAVALVSTLGCLVGVPVLVETLTRGRSLGKLAAGLRVVRDDGGPIRARHALVRGLLGFLELYGSTGAVAVIASLANPQGKRVGDLLAGTYVIRERTPPELHVPLVMPPALAGWAVAADLGRIPEGLAAAARQYVGRAGQLSPQVAEQLGTDLVEQLSRHVSPAPPGRPTPHEVISAVLTERRRRDHVRLVERARARDERERRRRSTYEGPGTTSRGPRR